jgi:hypothetical protein
MIYIGYCRNLDLRRAMRTLQVMLISGFLSHTPTANDGSTESCTTTNDPCILN